MAEPLHADQIASRDFSTSFRGFDQHEVRSFLAQVATELATAQERERALVERVAELEAAPPAALDEAALEQALGQEATRVIHAAREAASDIRERAEANAAKILQEANDRNATARADADALSATVRREAEEQAARIVEEAEATRDKVLKELQRRRKQALAQLEQLHEARARLEGAYEHVRATLDAATAEVAIADDEAVAIAAAAVAPAAASTESEPAAAPSDEPAPGAEAATSAEEPAPEPEVVEEHPAAVVVESPQQHDDDRRSSSLRVVRNPEPVQSLQPLSHDDFEGVRIIRPEPAAAPDPEPAATEVVADAAAAEDVEDVEAEPAPEPVVATAADPEPEPEPVVEATVEPDPEPEGEPDPEPEAAAVEQAPVEDLFARLRADRAEKTAAAVAVLADPVVEAPEADVEVIADPEPEAEPSGDAALLTARDGAIAEIERNLVRSVKRALADEQNEVLDALRRLKGRPSVEVIMPDGAVHEARYEAVLASAARTAALAGGTGDGAAVALERGRGVAVDLRGRIQRALDDAGGDVETLIDAISATYREWKSSRTEALARDVVTAAYAHGAYAAAAGALRWVVDPAEGGCPDCDDNALAGATPKGTAFPTGQLHPPAHAGCRCIVVAATT